MDVLPASGAAGPWHLIFDDEFNGSVLDATKWTTGLYGGSGFTGPINLTYGIDVMAASQVSVAGGAVAITAILETNTSSEGTFPYTSGAIMTASSFSSFLFSFTYGYAEARLWLPANGSAIANWPAFWLYATAGNHTYPNGEIDIVEGLGGLAEGHLISSAGTQGPLTGSGSFVGGWHTFAVDWEPGAVTWYYDGASIGSFVTQIPSTPMLVILNQEVSTSVSPPAIAPATMLADYVRVWQH